MIYRKFLFSIPIYGIFLILLTPYVYATGAARDYDEAYEDVPGAPECWYDGYEDGQNNPFNHERNKECKDMGNQYYRAFIHGCKSVEGNTDNTCELRIEGHELYCPDNPAGPACTEFLHNATNKKPAEICNSPGCFKDQDAEKYCLNYNDPTFCKTVGDICDADGFVKPEYPYCK